ncbi:hypothetical protein [Alysiella crassa]|uniref:hypothetical protein n=1 Tax=Alysiella crassa TaxID=153491 RepID=UPI0012EC59A5|nr:hypothetical protein [Alysiella crassa]
MGGDGRDLSLSGCLKSGAYHAPFCQNRSKFGAWYAPYKTGVEYITPVFSFSGSLKHTKTHPISQTY